LSVLSGLKSFPKTARASSAVGIGKQISVIALLGGLDIVRNWPPSMRLLVQPIAASPVSSVSALQNCFAEANRSAAAFRNASIPASMGFWN